MSLIPITEQLGSRKLTVAELVEGLESEGFISPDNAKMTLNFTNQKYLEQHGALWVVAQKKWPNEKIPNTRIDQDFMVRWLANKVGVERFKIDPLKTDVGAVTQTVSQKYATIYGVLPVEVTDTEIVVATSEPYDKTWTDEVSRVNHKTIRFVLSTPDDIRRYTAEFYNLSQSVKGAEARQQETPAFGGIQNFEQLMELGKKGDLDANDQHVVSIVDWLLQYAFDQRASDIHLEPRREIGHVRFRIDGVMQEVYKMPATIMNAVTSRLKILSRMDVAEKRRPQDGRLKTKLPDTFELDEIELRLSTMPTAFGEKMVMRIFDPTVLVKTFSDLGFPKQDEQKWNSMIAKPHGIILVTGPTGSGKTTTLYSTLRHLAKPEVNVCTIEDPIELIEPAFNQMQVQHKIGLDFSTGVKTLLRQDPDIIMLGEIRDLATAEMAVQAALTGHLVLSTLHTNDAPSALTRLSELGVPAYLTSATLLGVVAQRLVRTLCVHCKEPTKINEQEWASLTHPWNVPMPKNPHKPSGCDKCRQTGFLGRVGLYETLMMTDELRSQANDEQSDLQVLRKHAIKSGMTPLRIAGANKVSMGLTTIEEVLKVAPPSINN